MSDSLTPDQSAAHRFLVELRTRISTQPLAYQSGVEGRALESLWEVFGQAREAMKEYPGCEKFAAEVSRMLNVDLRPVTSKWHRAHAEGRLDSRDGADEFREELADVQQKLRAFAARLHQMAYGMPFADPLCQPVWTAEQLENCFADLAYGIPRGTRDLPDKIVDGINDDEAAEVEARRQQSKLQTVPRLNAVGLAFSGGGIRSAVFCLGVTQALAARGFLNDVDFLSTVSGGGYTGSFLTARLGTDTLEEGLAAPYGPDPKAIQYVRHHAKFLNPLNFRDAWTMVTATIAGMLLNWSAPFLAIVLAAMVAVVFRKNIWDTFWLNTLTVTGMIGGLGLIAYCGLLRMRRPWSTVGGWLLAITTGLTAGAAACWLIDLGYVRFDDWLARDWRQPAGLGFLGALVAAGPAMIRFFPLLEKPVIRRWLQKIALTAAGLVIPILALLLFYLCRHIGDLPGDAAAPRWKAEHYGGLAILACAALIFALIGGFLLNINLTAPHRLYRDRLAATFIHTAPHQNAVVPLAQVNPSRRAPYHLINTTLNLPASEEPALRDRRSAFFLFSKHWCGSGTTGYHKTTEWKTNREPVDLATVMAVSGAAASSYMGILSMPGLAALLTFLNVRLGFWIQQPGKKLFFYSPGFLRLLSEMTAIGMTEKAAWLNLSDGGHIENTGIYELLRRRCKFIICVDGEADPDYAFGALITLVRHAQIDYGIRIQPRFHELRPDPKTGFSRVHSFLCPIHYPADLTGGKAVAPGLLLYLKLSMTGNEPELLQRYRASHPDFPHQCTADQFFDEHQFEAYRQLGAHVTDGLFSRALMNSEPSPTSIPAWFRHLAANLMEPDQL